MEVIATMKTKKKLEFSKLMIVFETLIVSAMSLCTMYFCYLSIKFNYTGALPYLTAMTTAAWGAYGFSAKFYYQKACAENKLKIELGNVPTIDMGRDGQGESI